MTPSDIKSLVSYDAQTGKLTWKARPREMFANENVYLGWHTKCHGKQAFTAKMKSGYLSGRILGKTYYAHRVAWLLHYGKWPEHNIDHINGNPTDNRICNLRDVPQVKNTRNSKSRAKTKAIYPGVRFNDVMQKWVVEHGTSKGKYLGSFPCTMKAVMAKRAAEQRDGYHVNHGRMT